MWESTNNPTQMVKNQGKLSASAILMDANIWLGPIFFSILTVQPKAVKQRPYLTDLAVHPDHRRQGIASALMAEAEGRVKEMGFEELFLGVSSSNEPALNMYTDMGYAKNEPKSVVIETDQKKKKNSTILLRRSFNYENEAL
mmetsp:Transcript_31824/g.63407  ORF Transcript_31824/g.63407 Transcript_31824/m.63407 type:complete len:142 (-) Transcript_31824:142-567(-)